MLVENLVGTGARTCACGSWLAHWLRGVGQRDHDSVRCSVTRCPNLADDGAHVVRRGLFDLDPTIYIVPFCHRHNLEARLMMLTPTVRLVPEVPCPRHQ